MFKKGIVSVIASVIAMGLGYLFQFYMIRNLTPSTYGDLSVVFGILMILTAPLSSLDIFLTRKIAKLAEPEKEGMYLIKTYSKKVLLYSSLLAAVVFAAALILNILFKWDGILVGIPIITLGIPLLYFNTVWSSYFRGNERINFVAVLAVVLPALKLMFGILLISLGLGFLGASFSLWLGGIGVFLMFTPFLIKKTKPHIVHAPKLEKSFLYIMITLVLGMVIAYLGLFFIKITLNSEQVAYFNVALITSTVISILGSGVIVPFLPKVSKLTMVEWKKILMLLLKGIMLILPIFIVFIIFPEHIITFFYTAKYDPAVLPFMILSISAFLATISSLLDNIFWSQHLEKFPLAVNAVSVVLLVPLFVFLIPLYGIAGAALAMVSLSAIGLCLRGILMLIVKRKYETNGPAGI